MRGGFLGPSYSDNEIENILKGCGANYKKLSDTSLIEQVASALADGKVVGWMQGRMEFGPRALGSRSIIADPRSPTMQKQLNLKIKYRESFRPFAPSILREYQENWFDIDTESPYMLLVAKIKKDKQREMSVKEKQLFGIEKLNVKRSTIPAVTHIDYSARIQTVDEITNPKYHAVISAFAQKTGCPIVVNTSFNVRGEPIVCTPRDAFNCFMGTELDILAIGNIILFKEQQNIKHKTDYQHLYPLD